jgi:hypothetical protein
MSEDRAMEQRQRALPSTRCEARTRTGKLCAHPAGYGTDHLGRGRCRYHGGCTPSQRKHVAHEEALDFARGALGAEVADNPIDALLQAVRLASGAVAYWRMRLHGYQDGEAPQNLIEGFNDALDRQARTSKAALDGRVDERLVAITERMAEQITLAAEEALAAIELGAEQRTTFARTFAAALARLEGEPIEAEAKQLAA